ncbi:hypothetical protein AB3S75_032233 [Citrus x aurantiifolia]
MILPLLRVLQVQVSCFPGSGLNFFLQLTMIFVYRLVSLFAEHVCRIVSYGSTYKNRAIKKSAAEDLEFSITAPKYYLSGVELFACSITV